MNVVLAEDHAIVRQSLAAMLDAQPGIFVVGEAADGIEALALVETLGPGVLVTDLVMPGLGGLDLTREVRRRFRDTRVVVLSMHAEEAYVVQALRNGASGFVQKDDDSQVLIEAVRHAALGKRYFSPGFSQDVIDAYERRAAGEGLDAYETLTPREREILLLTAEGLSSRAIGERRFISPRTVETHRANLMRKLRLANRTELVRFAVERGLLPQP